MLDSLRVDVSMEKAQLLSKEIHHILKTNKQILAYFYKHELDKINQFCLFLNESGGFFTITDDKYPI